MRKFKKFIALLMTVMMFISMLPMDALAEIIAGGGNASSGQQFPISVLSVVPDEDEYVTFEFYVNGTPVDTQIINKTKGDETVNEPKQPAEAVGQKFLGWFVGETPFSFGVVNDSSSYSGTVRVDAKFEEVFYVFFLDESGRVITTKEGANGASISTEDVTIPLSSTTEGLTGWYYDADLKQPVEEGKVTINGANITLYPKVEDGHWLTFDSDGGTYHAPKFYLPGVATVDPGETTKLGYTFAGWYNGETRFDFGGELLDNVTLTAHWTANTNTKYTVIHWQENANDDGYSFKESETKTGTTGATTNATAKRTNRGDYQGFTAQTITQGTIAGDGSTIVNVYYKRNNYTLKFRVLDCDKWWSHSHDDSCYKVLKTITAKYQADIHSNFPIKDGDKTIWWTVPSGCTSYVPGNYLGSIDTMPAENITFTKYDSESGAKIYYYVETLNGAKGDTSYNGKNYNQYKVIDLKQTGRLTYKEEFHPITGFTQGDSDPKLPVDGRVNTKKNNYLYYTRNSYNIIFINNGSEDSRVEKQFEEKISGLSYTPNAPAGKENWNFKGWYDNESCEGDAYVFDGKTMPAKNITVYAKWVAPVVSGTAYITMAGDGDPKPIAEVAYGKTINPDNLPRNPQAPEGEGWVFVGWATKNGDNYTPFNFDTVIYANIELYPYFINSNKFSVTYDLNGGDGTLPADDKAYASGAHADIAAFPVGATAPEGMVFVSWKVKETDEIKYPGDKIKVTGDIILVAQYAPVQGKVSVTYHSNFDTDASHTIQQIPNNGLITVKDYTDEEMGLPARAGYTFQGWSLTPGGTTVEFAANTSARVNNDGSNDLYAVWEARTNMEYNVEFYYQEADGTYPEKPNRTDTRHDGKTGDTASVTDGDKSATEGGKYVLDESKSVLFGPIPATGTLTLKLYFKLNQASYTIHHYLWTNKGATPIKVAEDETGTMTIGETLDAARFVKTDLADYMTFKDYSPSQTKEITTNPDDNVIIIYYKENPVLHAAGFEHVYDGETHTMAPAEVTGANGFEIKYSYKNNNGEWVTTEDLIGVTYVTEGGENGVEVKVTATKEGYKPLETTVYLKITKRPLTLTGKGLGTIKYTGEPYTTTNWEAETANYEKNSGLVGNEQVDTDTLSYLLSGTYIGEYTGKFTENPKVKIYDPYKDEKDSDTTENYEIQFEPGTLTITGDSPLEPKKETTSAAPDNDKGYTVGDTITYTITVKNVSKNMATGVVVTDKMAEILPGANYAVTNEHTATLDFIPAGGTVLVYAKHTVTAEDVENALKNTDGTLTNVANINFNNKDMTVTGDPDKLNDTYEYVVRYLWNGTDEPVKTEEKGTGTVGGEVTETPATVGGYTPVSTDSQKLTIKPYKVGEENPNVITFYYYKNVKLTANSKTETYDGTEKSVSGFTIYGENTDAAGAKIAADFSGDTEIKAGATGREAGEYPANFEKDYVGTVTVDNTDRYIVTKTTPGTLTITKQGINIIVTGNHKEYVYNGTAQSVAGFTYETLNGEITVTLAENKEAYAERTDVGTTYMNLAIDSFVVTSKNYEVTIAQVIDGYVTINPITENTITITAASGEKVYDGAPLTNSGYTYTEGVLVEGDELTAVVEGSQTNAGSSANVVTSYKVMRGNIDVTSNYTFAASVNGTLTVTKRPVKITVNNNTVTYDGKAHGAYDPAYVAEQAALGADGKDNGCGLVNPTVGDKQQTHTLSGAEVTFTAVDAGTYTDKLDIVKDNVKIMSGNTNVAGNYTITIKPGTLTINAGNINEYVTLKPVDVEKVYDGTPLAAGTATAEDKNGNALTIEYSVGGENWTTDPSTITATEVKDSKTIQVRVSGTNYTGYVTGEQKLTIKVRPITLTGHGWDASQPYTGEEYSKTTFGVEQANAANDRGLVSGETLEAKYVLKGTLVGSYTGVFDETATIIKAGDKNVTANYEIAYVPGTLTITGEKIVPNKEETSTPKETNYKLGEKIEFTITVKNVSNEAVQGVTVTDPTAEIQEATDGSYTVSNEKHTATIAEIKANSEIKIKALHTVTSEDILKGTVGNTATVKWDNTIKNVSADTKKLDKPIVTMEMTKNPDWAGKADGEKLKLGTEITYTITVKNTGNVPYTNVRFTDVLQNGDATVTGNIPVFGTLAVDEEKSFQVKYTVTEADLRKGSITNKVTATADKIEYTYYEGNTAKLGEATPTGSAKVTNNTTGANASTSSIKTTTSTPKNGERYALDETITYDITVTNNGNQTVTNIEVVDELADAEIVPGTGYDIKNGVAVIDKLEPGHSVTVKAKYEVKEKDILAGKVVNSATVNGKDPDDKPIDPDEPKTDEDPTDKPKATLNIKKEVVNGRADGTPYGKGEKITYKLTVSVGADNNVTVKNVKVTDELLTAANVKGGIVEIKGGYTLNEHNEIVLGDMAPKAADVVIEYTYTVQESNLGKNGQYGNVHNAATAAGTTPVPDDPEDKPKDPTGGAEENTPTKIKLTITADSASKAYDGTPLTKDSYTSGQLAEGHKIDSVTITGSITEVGSTSNVASNAVIKAGEKDVTSHYDIEYKDGTLKITKGDIKNYVTLTPANVEKVYDGKTYTSGTATATDSNGNALKIEYSVDGEKWTTDPSTITATNVADSKTIQVRVSSEGNYEGYVTGTQKLTITKRSVTLTSEGGSKPYDGTPLTKPKVTIGGDKFVDGEVTDVKATGSVTFVSDGEVTNTITYTTGEKFDANNYSIGKTEGTLSITQRTEVIVITTPTRTRAYNGNRLVDLQTTHTGTILEGERLVVRFPADAGLTDAGSKANEYASYYVERISDGKDVTANYTFGEPVIGTLKVTPVAIELTANSASKAYDGTALTDDGYTITKGEFVTRQEKIDGKYVDVQEGLAKVTVVGSQTVVGSSANTITGHELKSNTLAQNYAITYKAGTLTVSQNDKTITVTANSHTWEYDGQPHSDGGYKVEYDGKTYTAAADGSVTLPNGDVVKATVAGTVTNVADSKDGNNKVTDVTITKDGEDRKGQYATITPVNGTLTITPRTLTISINRASKPYNGTMQDVTDAATGLEYTYTGLAGTDTISHLEVFYGPDKNPSGQKYAGTYEAVIGEDKNGEKILQIVNKETNASVLGNYEVKVNNGQLIIEPAQIDVYVYGGDGETVYNGKLQTLPDVTNIRYDVDIEEGVPPVITSHDDKYIVVNGLAEGDTLAQGTLRYLLAGTDANCTQPDKDHVIPGKEIEGKFIDPAGNAYSNNSKPYDASQARPTVLNGEGDEAVDVSANYVFTYRPGNFYIKPRPVTITAKDGNWTYDAQKHTESGVIAEAENGDTGLVSGHEAKATMTEESWIIDAGTKANVIETKDGKPQVKITANGVDVTANYVITTEKGTLKVFQRGDPAGPDKTLVTITATSYEVRYNGKMHGAQKNDKGEIVEGVSFTKENFVDGHTVKAGTVSITGEAKLVGTYEDLLVPGTEKSVVILDKDNNDVTKNYFITFVPGDLTITGEEIDEPEKKYDKTRKYDLGDEIPFTITVTNVSKTTVENVRVTEQADATIIEGDDYKVENGVAVIASIAPEKTVIVNAVHIVTVDDLEKFWNENQGYENNALITWPNGTREAHAEVEEFEDPTYTYDLTKEIYPSADHPDITKPYYKDEVVTFKITVKNTGNMRQTIELTEDSIGLNGVMPDLEKTTVTVDPGKSESVSATVFATVKIDETILAVRNGNAFNRIWANNGKGKDDSKKYADATLPLPALHKLTIKYVLENGNPISIDPASAWKYEIELRAGEKYSRLSPVLNNLETDTPLVEGVMPDHDLEITVIYTGNGGGDNPGGGGEEEPKKENERDTTIRIRDYETPLGLSNVFMNAGDCFE